MPGGRGGKQDSLAYGGALLAFSCSEEACFTQLLGLSSTGCVSTDRPRDLKECAGGLLGLLDLLGDATPSRLEGVDVLLGSPFPSTFMLASAAAADATAFSSLLSHTAVAIATALSVLHAPAVVSAGTTALSTLTGPSTSMLSVDVATAAAISALRDDAG